jgi:hypothetical protein
MIGSTERGVALAQARHGWLEWLLARQSAIVLALALAVLAFDAARSLVDWQASNGAENEAIARAIAAGHGFSIPGRWRWMFEMREPAPGAEVEHHPTAWLEPLPAYLLAAGLRLFGEHGRLVMLLLQSAALALTVWLTWRIGRRLPLPAAGLAAALLLALLPYGHLLTARWLGNVTLGALALTLVALATLRCLETPSPGRGAVLGLALGVAALTHAAALVLLPIAVGAVLLMASGPLARRAGPALLALLLAAAVVTPWAARNHAAFGELVLVRDGVGFNAHVGNPGLAALAAERAGGEPGLAAIDRAFRTSVERAGPIYSRSIDMIEGSAPADWPAYNQSQRDRHYLARALEFMAANPLLTLELCVAKLGAFLFPTRRIAYWPLGLVTVLAVVGLAACRRSPQAWLLALLVAAYTALFVLTAPLWVRYRFSIEPLISVLAGAGLVWIAGAIAGRLGVWPPYGSAPRPAD